MSRVIFTALVLASLVIVASLFVLAPQAAKAHPLWQPPEAATELSARIYRTQLAARLAPYLNMTDEQLRALLDNAGRANPQNIEMVAVTYDLALLYHLSGSLEAAHRAAVLLLRYAEVFPHWPKEYCTGSCGIWTSWYHNDLETPMHLALAYDLIYHSGAFETIGPEAKARVREFLVEVVKADLNYRLYVFNWAFYRGQALVVFGRVLEDPELTHLGYWFYDKTLHEYYTYDGFMSEGTYSYHLQMTPRFIAESHTRFMNGYSDPPDYVHVPFEPEYDAERIDNFDTSKYAAAWARMNASLRETALPNREFPILNDTHYFPDGARGRDGSPPEGSLLLPGIGHAILAYGQGRDQTQARLDFSPALNHHHKDALHLIFYAKGREVVGGTGYNAGDRAWNTTTFNQNLVSVNEREQKGAYWVYWTDSPYVPGMPRRPVRRASFLDVDTNHHNNLLLWEPGYRGDTEVQVVEVDATDAYRDDVDLYRRLLALVHIGDGDTYLVDFFRVRGGSRYDWQLHGGHTPYTLSTNLEMEPVAGALGTGGGAYEGITELEMAETADTWEAVLDYGSVRNRIVMAGAAGTAVYRGRGQTSPPWDQPNRYEKQDYLVVRRDAEPAETVDYLAVHEVYAERPKIRAIEKLSFEGDPGGTAVGIAVHLEDGTTDYVIHTLDDQAPYPEYRVQGVDGLAVRGRFAHVRVKDGQVQWLKLLQGGELRYGDRVMRAATGDYSHRGQVLRVHRKERGAAENSFEVDVALPEDGSLSGKALIVEWGNGWTWGYTIERVEGTRILVAEEPGFDYDGGGSVSMRYFPVGEYPGPVRFLIPGSAYMDASGTVTATGATE